MWADLDLTLELDGRMALRVRRPAAGALGEEGFDLG
jgi:hypothetical protein